MASSVNFYNQTRTLLATGDVDFSSLRVMLRDSNTTFNAQHTIVNNLLGNEVSGNGWPSGGVTIPNTQVSADNGEAVLTANDVVVTAINGAIGPASSAVIFDDQNRLLFFIDFVETKSATSGTSISFLWENGELIRWS